MALLALHTATRFPAHATTKSHVGIPYVALATTPIYPPLHCALPLFHTHSISSQQLKSHTTNNNSIRTDCGVGLLKRLTACSSSANVKTLTKTAHLGIWNVGIAPAFGEDIMQEVEVVPDTPETHFISILLIAAFIGLSLLSIGLIYLAVTEFLEKRERDKMLKDEEAKRKKEKKSKGVKLAKSGPRGFGQRIQDDDD